MRSSRLLSELTYEPEVLVPKHMPSNAERDAAAAAEKKKALIVTQRGPKSSVVSTASNDGGGIQLDIAEGGPPPSMRDAGHAPPPYN